MWFDAVAVSALLQVAVLYAQFLQLQTVSHTP